MSPELTKAMRSGEWGHMVAFRRAPGVLVCRRNIKHGSLIMEERKEDLGLDNIHIKTVSGFRKERNDFVKPKVQV